MKSYISNSEEETRQIAKNLAINLSSNIIALSGELGAGKTIFAQGFAKGLRIKEKIISPTFVLIRQYEIVRPHKIPNSQRTLFHIDLYRLEEVSLKQLGLEEILSDENNIILIEWAEKIKKSLPKNKLRINIEKLEENKRAITID